MLLTLALRHVLVRPVRAAVLLGGFALGVAVMIVLLSVGEAMLAQSRDVALVGGGEVTVLPEGIDVEAMRTGGVRGLFFGIDRARFVTRQLVGGPRHRAAVRAVSPVVENAVLFLEHAGVTHAVRAGADVPSRARAVGAALDVRAGRWDDTAADSAWIAPGAQRLYDELDRFHRPAFRDTTWAEWHYFNVVTAPDEWWYVTYLVGGDLAGDRWGGRLLVTRRRPDGGHEQFTADVAPAAIAFDTARADVTLGASTVRQREGTYRIVGRAAGPSGPLRFDLEVAPERHRLFPPVELGGDGFTSGYVVPALRATARGSICVAARCAPVQDAPAYHDHNWGVWRAVTWEWGMGRGGSLDILYGGVRAPEADLSGTAFFLALADSLGIRQVLRFREVAFEGRRATTGAAAGAPERFTIVASRGRDTVTVRGDVEAAHASVTPAGDDWRFLQMRARFRVDGRLGAATVRDSGRGFFETYVRR